MKNIFKSEIGASSAEYVIAALLLVVAIMLAGPALGRGSGVALVRAADGLENGNSGLFRTGKFDRIRFNTRDGHYYYHPRPLARPSFII